MYKSAKETLNKTQIFTSVCKCNICISVENIIRMELLEDEKVMED